MRASMMGTALLIGIGLHAFGQTPSRLRDHFEISAREVARALSKQGMQIEGNQVTLLARVVATEQDPLLEAVSIVRRDKIAPQGSSGAAFLVKVECHRHGICLPFYAIAHIADERQGFASGELALQKSAGDGMPRPNAKVVMKAGTHATLVRETGRSRVEVTVISLENGGIGQEIHVVSADRKQEYVGEVETADVLKWRH